MATAKIINNILKDEVIDVEVIDCKTVGDVVEKYVNENGYVGSIVECYDPETDTTTFIPLEDESNLSLSVCVNNKDANLSTEIKEDDIVTVIVLPAGGINTGTKWGWWGAAIGGAIGTLIGLALGGPWGALAGVVIGGIAGGIAGFKLYYNVIQPLGDKDSSSYDKGLEGESTLGVRGSSNQSLVGNNYPVVLGKHLTTPFIVGSSYSTATGEYGIDQEIRVLYAVGYAPLKLTDFKLDSIMMAHNQSWKNNTDLKTIMHGKLSGVEDGDKGEITNSFYNNDIEIEILQQNPESDTVDYGTIYNQATIEKEIKATPLFIADKDLDEVAQTKYKGCRFPCYFRNNTVRFSQPCAKKITLELQASSGLYKTWTHSSGSSSTTKYGSMPIWYAIQYRIYNKNNASSDAESGTGWTSFTSFNADTNHPVNAQVFTEAMRVADLDSHSGNSFSDDAKNTLNKKWVGEFLFNFQDAFDTSDNQNNVSDMRFTGSVEFTLAECKEMLEVTDPAKIVEIRMIRVSPAYFDETSSSGDNGPVSYQDVITWNTVTTVKFDEEKLNEAISSDNTTTYQVLKNTYTRKVKNNQFTGYSKTSSQWITVTQDEYETYKADLGNKHEYNFTEWDWVLLVQCEEDQPMHSEGYLNYWSYENLRIVSKEIGDEIPPLKPLSEDKMRKLCIVALKAKADTGGNIKNQLKKFTVMAEAFQPYVDLDTQEIFPENVSKSVNYYYPNYYDDVQKEWIKGEQIEDTDTQTAKEIYEDLRLQGIKATAIKKGSDFVSQIDKLIFQDEFKDSNGRYFLNTDETSNIRKCNENNAISTALYWLIGPHAGADALDYSDIDLISAIEAFEDCNSVTDGSTYSKETTDEDGTVHQKGDLVKIKHCANTWLYKASKAEDVLANILVAGRSLYVRSESNKIRFIFDKEEEFPTMIVNQQNCLSHSITYSYEETPSGLIMEFPDEDDEYTTNTIYCMEDAEDSENPQKALESYNVSYCTNSYQTWSLGRYILANRVLNKKLLTAKVGWEGFNASIGSTVVVQLPTLLLGTDLGGRIKRLIEDDDYIYGFICDELFNYTGETETVDEVEQSTQGVEIFQPCNKNKSNCIILRLCLPNTEIVVNEIDDDGNTEEVHYKAEVGNTNVVIFANKISKADESVNGEASEILYYKPAPENIVNFGYVGSISETYRVTKIKADKDFNYDLTMLLYNPDIYNYGKALPTFQNHMTIPDRSGESYDLTNDLTPDVLTKKMTASVDTEAITERVSAAITSGTSASAPETPKQVLAFAYKDKISFSCATPDLTSVSDKLSQTISTYVWKIKRTDETEFTEIGQTSTNTFDYIFDRDIDGYPEADDFLNWSFTVFCKNIYNLSSEEVTGNINAYYYGTWLPNSVSNIQVKAEEDKLSYNWDYIKPVKEFYGELNFNVILKYNSSTRNEINTKETYAEYKFNREKDLYPEKSEIYESLDTVLYNKSTNLGSYSLVVNTIDSISGNSASTSFDFSNVDTSSYKTWIPDVLSVKSTANKNSLNTTWELPICYGTSKYNISIINKNHTETKSDIHNLYYNYVYDRSVDGYPESDDFSSWLIKVEHITDIYSVASVTFVDSIDISSYGTWLTTEPVVSSRVNDRTISLSIGQNLLKQTKEVYGDIFYKIQVKRPDIDTLFYKPNLSANPYPETKTTAYITGLVVEDDKITAIIIDGRYLLEDNCSVTVNSSEYSLSNTAGLTTKLILTTSVETSVMNIGDNLFVSNSDGDILDCEYTNEYAYRGEKESYQLVSETFIETMPLAGQAINSPALRDTAYYFRITSYNASTGIESSPVFVAVTALCTNIQDVVNANADYKELYVKNLSAIAVNLGIIKQGAFGSENQNHIAMSTVTDDNGNIWYKGDVRLGGDNEYLEIKPVVEDGEIIDYKITLKAGNISLTTSGSKIAEGTFVYDESDSSKRMRLSASGFDIEQAHYENNEIAYWETKALINTDQNGNLFIVNGDPKNITNCPIVATEISDGAIYHFDKNTLDQNGGNSGEITCTGELIDEPGVVSNDCFSGTITKNLTSVTKDVTMFRKQYIKIGNQIITTVGDISSDPDAYNDLASTKWGLTSEQIANKLFKIRY